MLTSKYIRVEMFDSSIWEVPVAVIAANRANYFAHEFDNFEQSLKEDTIPLFINDEYEILDWATNNMDWVDVAPYAVLVKNPVSDYQEGWMNGVKAIISK